MKLGTNLYIRWLTESVSGRWMLLGTILRIESY